MTMRLLLQGIAIKMTDTQHVTIEGNGIYP